MTDEDIVIKISAAFDGFIAAGEQCSEALAKFADAMASVTRWNFRALSGPGDWAYRFATWLGFSSLDVLTWLETCPGAFADEFGDGWQA